MTDIAELRNRLDEIEALAESRPGEALDELEDVTAELDGALTEHLAAAHRLVRNEDFAGAAQALGENAAVLQRTANLSLVIREETRRRR